MRTTLTKKLTHQALASATLLSLLAACGGGGGGTDATAVGVDAGSSSTVQAENVPTAASQGIGAFAGWLKQMSGQTMEDRESMNTGSFSPTLDDEAEAVVAPD